MTNLSIGSAHAESGEWRAGRSAVAVAALCALLLMTALTGSAAAGARDWRVGVMDGVLGSPDVQTMRTVRPESLRILFNWEKTEPDTARAGTCPAGYHWAYLDRLVRDASDANVALLPVILGSPDYVSRNPTRAPDTGKREIENYKCFVRAVVGRYGRGGSYPPIAAGAVTPVKEWQVWNEPNLPRYNVDGRKVSPREYGRLLKVTTRQIRNEDRRATIALAGVPEVLTNGMRGLEFLRKLYGVRGIERKFDVVALHAYAENVRGVEGALTRLRKVLRNVGDRNRYVWVTEVGWGTHGPPGQDSFLRKTERGQARELRRTFQMLRENRDRFKVGTVHWFRWRDTAAKAEDDSDPFSYAGLFRKYGTFKPSCRAFTDFTGGRCRDFNPYPQAGTASAAGGSAILAPDGAAAEPLPSPPEE